MSASRVAGAVLAVILTVAVAWISRVPVEFGGQEGALIRLSWRADGVTVEACEELSEEELASRPIHMRNPLACIGEIAPFELSAFVADEPLLVDTISAGGARGDRPIYVLRDLSVIAGRHDVRVRFRALVPDGADVGDAQVEYLWEGQVSVASDDIALLTLDDRGAFVLLTPEG
jgi:hypothetical protein